MQEGEEMKVNLYDDAMAIPRLEVYMITNFVCKIAGVTTSKICVYS